MRNAGNEFAGVDYSYDEGVEAGDHRRETRRIWCIPVVQIEDLYQLNQSAGLQTVVIVERTRRLWNKTTHEVQYFCQVHFIHFKMSLPCPFRGGMS